MTEKPRATNPGATETHRHSTGGQCDADAAANRGQTTGGDVMGLVVLLIALAVALLVLVDGLWRLAGSVRWELRIWGVFTALLTAVWIGGYLLSRKDGGDDARE